MVTVSPSYAEQIQRAADGMEHLLHNVAGINNGVGSDFRARALARLKEEDFVRKNTSALYATISKDTVLQQQLRENFPELLEQGALEKMKKGRRHRVLERMRLSSFCSRPTDCRSIPSRPSL